MTDPATAPDTTPLRTEYMLTTFDNPYDPWTEFDAWYAWDQTAGYNTAGLLARITKNSPDLSEGDQHMAVQDAIDEIVRENVRGIYQKIARGQHERFGTTEVPST